MQSLRSLPRPCASASLIVITLSMASGQGGSGTLTVEGKVMDSHPMPGSLPISLAWDENLRRDRVMLTRLLD